MERKDRSTVVSIRIPDGLLERIEKDIEENGDFTSRADYILSALRQYEDYRTKIIAERKAAFGGTEEEDFVPTPSGNLQLRDDEVKG